MKAYMNPIGAMLEITSVCNLNCSHCYNSNSSGKKQDLPDEVWVKLVTDICKKKVENILFTGGEPFVKEKLLKKLLRIVSEHTNMKVFINTNGQTLNQDFVDFCKKITNPVHFQISIDGAYPILHEKVRQVAGSWEKAVKACLLLCKNNVDFRIAHTINLHNYDFLEEMVQLAIFTGAKLIGMGVAVPLGRGKEEANNLILDMEKRQFINNKIHILKEKYKKFIVIEATSVGGRSYYEWYCQYFQDWLLINSEGYVKLENRLPYLVGNIKKESIESLWKKVNWYQKSEQVMRTMKRCMDSGEELDSQEFIYL